MHIQYRDDGDRLLNAEKFQLETMSWFSTCPVKAPALDVSFRDVGAKVHDFSVIAISSFLPSQGDLTV